jgi:hypothetical protein
MSSSQAHFFDCFTLKKKSLRSSKRRASIYQSTLRRIPEEFNLQQRLCKNFISSNNVYTYLHFRIGQMKWPCDLWREGSHSDTVHLKWDGTRWRTGEEVKGKLANGVGSQYSSHYPTNMVYPAL